MWRLVAGLERFVLAASDFVVHCCNINGRARFEETKMFFRYLVQELQGVTTSS